MQSWSWISWNIFLAVIPVVCAYALAAGIKNFTLRGKRVPWIVWLPLAIVWLAFLPNTCYLLTEWRHFLFDPDFTGLRQDAGTNRVLMLDVARQGLFFLIYSAIGVVCYALSIRPIEQVLRMAKKNLVLLSVPFFLLISLGVYMGLIVRLNSWDIVKRPLHVWNTVVHAVTTPLLVKTIVVFAILLWLIYQAVDVWVDGIFLRLKKRGWFQGNP